MACDTVRGCEAQVQACTDTPGDTSAAAATYRLPVTTHTKVITRRSSPLGTSCPGTMDNSRLIPVARSPRDLRVVGAVGVVVFALVILLLVIVV